MRAAGFALFALACDPEPTARPEQPERLDPGPQDILTTGIALDLGALTGQARVVVQPEPGTEAVTLDVSGLTLSSVTVDGAAVEPTVRDGRLLVPAAGDPLTIAGGKGGRCQDVAITFFFPETSFPP
jgi:aminopeptidase N